MNTPSDALDIVVEVLNVSTVTNTITGGAIYRHKRPLESKNPDVVVLALPQRGGFEVDLHEGTLLVNSYRKNKTEKGLPDESSLRSTAEAILQVLDAYSSSDDYLEFTSIIQSGILPDPDNSEMSVINTRINYSFQTEGVS
jgi:hypothetical protein